MREDLHYYISNRIKYYYQNNNQVLICLLIISEVEKKSYAVSAVQFSHLQNTTMKFNVYFWRFTCNNLKERYKILYKYKLLTC